MKWESNSFLKELRDVASAILAGREFQRATTHKINIICLRKSVVYS